MKPISILYVEDNDRLREMIGELLAEHDREVHAYATAEAALIAFEKNNFDVLVSDVSLPGMSGVDLARCVLRVNPNHWVVLCSGYEFKHGLKELGPNVRALLKPFDVEAIEALLDEISAATIRITSLR